MKTYDSVCVCVCVCVCVSGELTQRRCAVSGEDLIFGLGRVEEKQVVEITDAVSQGADGEVFTGEGHQIPHHPLTCHTK